MSDVSPLVHVTAVEVIGEHTLRLTFEDGLVGDVSFGDHEWRGVFEPMRDPSFFAKVKVAPQFRHDRLAGRSRHGSEAALRRGPDERRRAA